MELTGNIVFDVIIAVSIVVASITGIVSGMIFLVVKPLKKWWNKSFTGKIITKKEEELILLKESMEEELDILRDEFQNRCSNHNITLEKTMEDMTTMLTESIKVGFKTVNERFDEMDNKISKLETRTNESEKKRQESQPRVELLIRGVRASLRAHKENGANGTVSPVLDEMDAYIVSKASE